MCCYDILVSAMSEKQEEVTFSICADHFINYKQNIVIQLIDCLDLIFNIIIFTAAKEYPVSYGSWPTTIERYLAWKLVT